MPRVYDSFFNWAKRTKTSFAELCFVSSTRGDSEIDGDSLIYRLKHWPELPATRRTANVFRALSVMSHRPVNRRWFATHSKLPAREVDQLLADLIGEDAVEVIDGSKYVREALWSRPPAA
jgi:hypothetical protein